MNYCIFVAAKLQFGFGSAHPNELLPSEGKRSLLDLKVWFHNADAFILEGWGVRGVMWSSFLAREPFSRVILSFVFQFPGINGLESEGKRKAFHWGELSYVCCRLIYKYLIGICLYFCYANAYMFIMNIRWVLSYLVIIQIISVSRFIQLAQLRTCAFGRPLVLKVSI